MRGCLYLKKIINKTVVVITTVLLLIMIFGQTDSLAQNSKTQIYTFDESTMQKQTQVVRIPNLKEVLNVTTTSGGTVTYEVDGDDITLHLTGKSPHRTEHLSKPASYTSSFTDNSSTASFPSSYWYTDNDGYSGYLSKSGGTVNTLIQAATYIYSQKYSGYIYGPTYSQYVSTSSSYTSSSSSPTFSSSYYYSSNGYSGYLSKSGSPSTVKIQSEASKFISYPTNNPVFKKDYNQWTGSKWVWVYSLPPTHAEYISYGPDSEGFSGTLSRQLDYQVIVGYGIDGNGLMPPKPWEVGQITVAGWYWNYYNWEGTVRRPAIYQHTQVYSGWVTKTPSLYRTTTQTSYSNSFPSSVSYSEYYNGDYYSGTLNKSGSAQRIIDMPAVYEHTQKYAGTVYKDVPYYQYSVKIEYIDNSSPVIEVTNGNEFINFIFSENGAYSIADNYYKSYAEGLYSEASESQKEGLFVVVNVTDPDAANWQKGSIKLRLPNGSDIPNSNVPIIWTDTGTEITRSNGNAKKGYAFVPKSVFVEPYNDYVDDAKVIVAVSDYDSASCSGDPLSTITQDKESSSPTASLLVFDIDKNMAHDTLAGELSINKTPSYIFTKWHKDENGNPAKMDINLRWTNLRLLTLRGDGTVLNNEPIKIIRVESEHILNRYTDTALTANGEKISDALSNVTAGSGTYRASYQYSKAGDENSPFIFRLYYITGGEEHYATVRINIPVNGIVSTLHAGQATTPAFKKSITATNNPNEWYYSGVWTQDGEISPPVFTGTLDVLWPLPGYINISSYFGQRIDPIDQKLHFHNGIDLPAPVGTSIISPTEGEVVFAGENNVYGNMLVIRSGGYDFMFGHCSSILVTNGQAVTKGQEIAKVGSTGRSTGPHLHFGVALGPYTNNNYVDPLSIIQQP